MFRQTNQYAAPVQSTRVDNHNYKLDAPSEMKGETQASQVHICRFEVLKRTLEILGSRQLKKQGNFVITESQN